MVNELFLRATTLLKGIMRLTVKMNSIFHGKQGFKYFFQLTIFLKKNIFFEKTTENSF